MIGSGQNVPVQHFLDQKTNFTIIFMMPGDKTKSQEAAERNEADTTPGERKSAQDHRHSVPVCHPAGQGAG